MSPLQSILQQIYAATHSAGIQAGSVPPLASPDAAVLAPNTPGSAPPPAPPMAASVNTMDPNVAQGENGMNDPAPARPSQGILGSIGSILAPQAGSFWESALRHGLAGANRGLIDDPVEHAMAIAKLQAEQGLAQQQVAAGRQKAAGVETLPTGDVVQANYDTPGSPSIKELFKPASKVQDLLEKWQSMTPAQQASPSGQLLYTTIMGPNFRYTAPVIAAMGEAKTKTAVAAKQAQKFAPKGGGKAVKAPAGWN